MIEPLHIGFDRLYTKLYGQKSGTLLKASLVLMDGDLYNGEAHRYNTDGEYGYTKGIHYWQLVFLGDKMIPFTTYRKWGAKSFVYSDCIGKRFEFWQMRYDIEKEDWVRCLELEGKMEDLIDPKTVELCKAYKEALEEIARGDEVESAKLAKNALAITFLPPYALNMKTSPIEQITQAGR